MISLPKFKTHGLTVMTGAIKNSYEILPGAQKERLHQFAGTPERFHELIVAVFLPVVVAKGGMPVPNPLLLSCAGSSCGKFQRVKPVH